MLVKTLRSFFFSLLLFSTLFISTGTIVFASGVTWTNQTTGGSVHNLVWRNITSSSDGTKLAAIDANLCCGSPGDIWTSTDSGHTWTNRTTGTSASGQNWSFITSSSDGTKLAAQVRSGDIWTSTNAGVTWTNQTTGTLASGLLWHGITSSSDGTKLAAVEEFGDIWSSTNSGVTWTDASTTPGTVGQDWHTITSSADGTKLAAVAASGDIWTSTDSGHTWTNQTTGTSASGLGWYSITSSSDGTKLAAVESSLSSGDLWTSTDSGHTWTNQTTGMPASGLTWFSITSSSDGTKLAATESDFFSSMGDIWISTDTGHTWTNQTVGTTAGGLNWYSVTSSADGTHFAAAIGHGDIWTATLSSPVVTISAPTTVYSTSLNLNATLTATGGDNATVRGFVYGPTTAYGATTTASGSFGTGAFTSTISNLTCNSGYHYAAYATNGYGTSYSSDSTFGTGGCAIQAGSGGGGQGVFVPYIPGQTGTQTNPPPMTSAAPATSSPTSFTNNHHLYDISSDIESLQEYLNIHGYVLAGTGPGSSGNETTFFGLLTYKALIKFQQAHDLPATGYFGPMTRGVINGQ